MKAKPLRWDEDRKLYYPCEPAQATHVELYMPGPSPFRLLPVILKGKRSGTGCWSWNGDTEKPTLKPLIRTTTRDGDEKTVCHTWINDGKAQFLADCTHELAGQTMDLREVSDSMWSCIDESRAKE